MLRRIVMTWSSTIFSCPPACKLSQTKISFSFLDYFICWLVTLHYPIWDWLELDFCPETRWFLHLKNWIPSIRCDYESYIVLVNPLWIANKTLGRWLTFSHRSLLIIGYIDTHTQLPLGPIIRGQGMTLGLYGSKIVSLRDLLVPKYGRYCWGLLRE